MIEDINKYGWSVAWYNVRWKFAYWLLGAKSMRVTRRKK